MDLLIIGLIGSVLYFGPNFLNAKQANKTETKQVQQLAENKAKVKQPELSSLKKQYDPLNPNAIYVEPSSIDTVSPAVSTNNSSKGNQVSAKISQMTQPVKKWYEQIKLDRKARMARHEFIRNQKSIF